MEAKRPRLEEPVLIELDPVVIIHLSSPNILKECLVLPHSPIQIDPTTTTPQEAVQKYISYIDSIATAQKGQLTYFRDGEKIPLHYEGFSCSNEQNFQDRIVGDPSWVSEIIQNNLSLGSYLVITGSESKMSSFALPPTAEAASTLRFGNVNPIPFRGQVPPSRGASHSDLHLERAPFPGKQGGLPLPSEPTYPCPTTVGFPLSVPVPSRLFSACRHCTGLTNNSDSTLPLSTRRLAQARQDRRHPTRPTPFLLVASREG